MDERPPHTAFPRTPLAGAIHLLDAGLTERGIPGLDHAQRDGLIAGRHTSADFLAAFSDVPHNLLQAAHGLYLAHMQGGFGPTNAALCAEALADVCNLLDADVTARSTEAFAASHRGGATVQLGRVVLTLVVTPSIPQAFRLSVQKGSAVPALLDLDPLDLDSTTFTTFTARFIAAASGLPLA